MEIIHDGWLLKSPPKQRLRAKWRNRWFVLRSGELPQQYLLEYYKDDTKKKLKGKIDLDQCEQVDAGITFADRKFEYKFMFDIKTPKRIYYLCAETEEAMNRWVDCVCQVCNLKVMNQEDLIDPSLHLNLSSAPPTPLTTSIDHHRLLEYPSVDSPPPSAASTVSGPYIPISECITGKKVTTRFPFNHTEDPISSLNLEATQRCSIPNEMAPLAPKNAFEHQRLVEGKCAKARESYDAPRQLRPPPCTSKDSISLQSPLSAQDGLSVVNVQDDETAATPLTEEPPHFAAPPRPPKPSYLWEASHQQNYMNLDSIERTSLRRDSSSEKVLSSANGNGNISSTHSHSESGAMPLGEPEPSPSSAASEKKNMPNSLYDLPRSHQIDLVGSAAVTDRSRTRHCYNNSAPAMQDRIFSYETHPATGETDPRISPLGIYSNIPQSGKDLPPIVDRGLKPKKGSDPSSHSASELSPTPTGGASTSQDIPPIFGAMGGIPAPPASAPPIVDRTLKPHKKISEPNMTSLCPPFVLDPAPRSRLRINDQRKPRAAPSPTPPAMRNGRGASGDSDTDVESTLSSPNSRRDSMAEEQIFFPLLVLQRRRSSHEIQYLDLDLESQVDTAPAGSPKGVGGAKIGPAESSVVYKKVDFVKTKAFNEMRQNVEDSYRTEAERGSSSHRQLKESQGKGLGS